MYVKHLLSSPELSQGYLIRMMGSVEALGVGEKGCARIKC